MQPQTLMKMPGPNMLMTIRNVMIAPRRFLPPVHLLVAFEAVARHRSVTAAAEELDLTQGAVSRQVQALEQQLAVKLFQRQRKRLRLTPAGSAYVSEIRSALKQIASASLRLKADPDGGTLNLAILPTFGTRWLTPRLPEFLAKHGGVTVNLTTRLVPFDFAVEGLDAAIHWGQADWPGAGHLKIMDEEVVPACSGDFLKDRTIRKPEELLGLPLLHLATRAEAWPQWFVANGVDPCPPLTGMQFDQFATMSKAAAHSVGVALLPTFLVERELAEGQLISAFGGVSTGRGAYYLTWPRERTDYGPLVRFRNWLSDEVLAS